MEKMKNVPEIRFEGFSEDWNIDTFENLTSINQGLQISIVNRYLKRIPNSHFYITNEFLKEGSKSEYYILNPPESVLCTKDDVLMTRTGNTGEVVTDVNGAFHNNFFKIDFDRKVIDKDYLVHFLKNDSTKALILNLAGVSTIPDLNHNDFYQITMPFPDIDEQIKISAVLNNLDNSIKNHNTQLKKLTNLKKAMLIKMFPQDGASVPEIRFKGFDGEWEEKPLSSEVEIVMGQSPDSKNYTENPKDHILVQGNADLKDAKVEPRLWTTQVTKKAEKGDLIFTVRAPVGDMAKTDFDIVIGRGVAAIRGNDFVFQTLKRAKEFEYWYKYSAGSTFDSINSEQLKNASFYFPCSNEQEKIGTYFKNLDDLISNHKEQLKKLNQIKKACLTKLFVSQD